MAELSIPYEIIGPDGSRCVVGNCDEAMADPDFVGFLDGENGLTGLLDTADLRERYEDLVEGDGGIDGAGWLGRRTGTLQGVLVPHASSMEVVNLAEDRLKRATRALRADGILRWTPSGSSARMLRIRRQGRVAISGRRPKAWQISLSSRDAYILSADEQSIAIDPANIAGEVGITDPITNPITSPLNAAAQTFIVNEGNAPSWPRIRIVGPISYPTILNNTTGESFRIGTVLATGDVVDIHPDRGAVLLNGANRFGLLDFPVSTWWQVQPGTNDIRALPTAYSAGAHVTIYWRHAWE